MKYKHFELILKDGSKIQANQSVKESTKLFSHLILRQIKPERDLHFL